MSWFLVLQKGPNRAPRIWCEGKPSIPSGWSRKLGDARKFRTRKKAASYRLRAGIGCIWPYRTKILSQTQVDQKWIEWSLRHR